MPEHLYAAVSRDKIESDYLNHPCMLLFSFMEIPTLHYLILPMSFYWQVFLQVVFFITDQNSK